MDRRRLLALALLAAAFPGAGAERFGEGVLWRVSRPGSAPSHLFGTLHMPESRLGPLPTAVARAFGGAASLTLEFLPDAFGKTRFLDAALFHDERTLEALIGAEDFARALERLKPLGLAPEFVNKLKPWGVLLNLRDALPAEGITPDARLAALARARRLPLHEMEGIEEQVFTFDELPMESQVALLKHSLAHYEELSAMAERTRRAYLARDLAALWRLQQEFAARYPEIADHQARLVKRVVQDRNVVMAYRMQRQLRAGRAFVAFGALHLYGGQGVLALLEQESYRVTRIY